MVKYGNLMEQFQSSFWQWLLSTKYGKVESSIPSPFDLVKMQATLNTLDLDNQLWFRNLI